MQSMDDVQEQLTWWQRPCGGRDVVRLALPLVLSTASWTLMHFVDRVFLTRYSTEAIAAAMPAGALHFSLICLPMGIASYVTTFVAQYYGAGQRSRIGAIVGQGILLGLFSVPLALLMIPLAPVVFPALGHPQGIVVQEVSYFQSMALGGGATVLAAALASFFTGLGATQIVMWVDVVAALINIALDYLLIFGVGGFPELGIAGAGYATSFAQWSKVMIFVGVMALPGYRQPYRLVSGCRWDGPLMRRLLRFGVPSGLQMFLEVITFTLMAFLMGRLGEVAMAATTVAFSVNSIAFVPMFGLGIAVSTIVGQQLGAQQPALAERGTWTAIVLGLVYTGVMALLYLGLPNLFLWAHATGRGSEFAQVAHVCRLLLKFVAAYCVLDMAQIVFVNALKGAGDTRFVLSTSALIAPLPALIGWFGMRQWNWGLVPLWWLVTGWITVMAVVYYLRFQFGPWRSMRVIEAEYQPDPVPEAASASETEPRLNPLS